jgi:hypothetical protein
MRAALQLQLISPSYLTEPATSENQSGLYIELQKQASYKRDLQNQASNKQVLQKEASRKHKLD